MTRASKRWRRLLAALGGVVVATAALTGCFNLQQATLPGGAAFRAKSYHVFAIFDDVLDLQPQASVRVNNIPVGDVEKITLQGFKAKVEMKVKQSVILPRNAFANLEQTSLLGEKYVSLAAPDQEKPYGQLKDGDVIDNAHTGKNAQFEEVFAALSALLNGGGVGQVQTISVELSNALAGRESQARDVLNQLNTLLGSLDNHRQDIIHAIEAIDRLSGTLAQQTATIGEALDDIPPALSVLADQRQQLTTMLTSLSHLGDVSDQIIRASRDNTVETLRNLVPVLGALDSSRQNIASSLELLLNYPFPATVNTGIHGDYAGLRASLNLNLTDLLAGLTAPSANGKCAPGYTALPAPINGCLPNSLAGAAGAAPASVQPSSSTGGSSRGSASHTSYTGPAGDYTAVLTSGGPS